MFNNGNSEKLPSRDDRGQNRAGDRMYNPSLARRWPAAGVEDEAVLARAAAGRDTAAFGELYRRYVDRVYRYLCSRVGEAAEAEDLTALVFTTAWESIPRYREQGNFAAWLFRIARNKVNDYYRRRRPQLSLDEINPELLVDWDPAVELERGDALRRLASLLSHLDPEQLELLRLRFAADLSFAEIASLLGRSEPAVKMALHRLLRRLQGEWEKEDE
jgi:RNA polymerase sigma-70 factor (ECF subfamily)